MTWAIVLIILMLAGIIILNKKSPTSELAREEYLQQLAAYLESKVERMEGDSVNYFIKFDFEGQEFVYEDVEIKGLTQYGPYDAVIPEVSGSAFITGQNTFYFDPDDPLKKGFIFR